MQAQNTTRHSPRTRLGPDAPPPPPPPPPFGLPSPAFSRPPPPTPPRPRRGLSSESCPRRLRASLARARPREHAQPCKQTTTQTRTYHPRPGHRVAQARRHLLLPLPRLLLPAVDCASRSLPYTPAPPPRGGRARRPPPYTPRPVRATPTQPTTKCPHHPTRRRKVVLLERLPDPPQRQTKGLLSRFVPTSLASFSEKFFPRGPD